MNRSENSVCPTFAARELYGAEELSRLLRPRSVAIVGASATPGAFGYRTLQNTSFGYTGSAYPINPRHREILGRACYPTIDSLPEVPDCVVLSVPAEQVLPIVEQCAGLGVGGAVIYSSGFLETGDAERVAKQQRLVEIARRSGMRILGPSCIGVMNFVDRVGLSFQPGLNELPMITGPIGLVVQSGGWVSSSPRGCSAVSASATTSHPEIPATSTSVISSISSSRTRRRGRLHASSRVFRTERAS
ncbi:MAG: hypothetical protein GEV05_23750 [Betaproteobacteria bacterium]|nr:hypothetical protein [Betaproteobacteria bacterium]